MTGLQEYRDDCPACGEELLVSTMGWLGPDGGEEGSVVLSDSWEWDPPVPFDHAFGEVAGIDGLDRDLSVPPDYGTAVCVGCGEEYSLEDLRVG